MSDRQIDIALLEDEAVALGAPWHVILYNDDVHDFDEVVIQVMKATGCSIKRAAEITLQAHTSGRAGAFQGDFEACFAVQRVLREIELVTEIRG